MRIGLSKKYSSKGWNLISNKKNSIWVEVLFTEKEERSGCKTFGMSLKEAYKIGHNILDAVDEADAKPLGE